jgi:hypothetical protein
MCHIWMLPKTCFENNHKTQYQSLVDLYSIHDFQLKFNRNNLLNAKI